MTLNCTPTARLYMADCAPGRSRTAHHGDTEITEIARTTREAPSLFRLENSIAHGNDDDLSRATSIIRAFRAGAVGLVDHPTNPLSERVIGAAVEVHRHLGPGLLESSYHACLCRELELRGISYHSQVSLPLEYKGIQVTKGCVIDLLIEESLVVEIKSVDKLLPIHSSQLMTYLRLRKLSSGLLINFNVHTLIHGLKRILR